jgi:flagellum-specific peptidoglycan hydrolase FlgJ
MSQKFRKYDSRNQSFDDYCKLLSNERYQKELNKIPLEQRKTDVKAVSKALKTA